jgi:hypothetical protein
MEPQLSCSHSWPVLLGNLQELAQDIPDVVDIYCGLPWHLVGVDEALGVKEGQDHLLAPVSLDLGLDGARRALSEPLFSLLLGGEEGCRKTPLTRSSIVTIWSSIVIEW